ncbi:protein of unknown function [Taphrina deformans PYCC 5710]|uniref:Secreted protein n=1 Tax=Taphrina deformans (strain PYCC 5710 / ATCC 11124 / CBS 356.35 / IMI 108563 / JCM 9778 / NBRC 8474) TaxID=1097556 RepID=R4XG85_TAPDE|nr:protein of unknown function [Taphrina deformans PYCC 5710]|eukprot:CCG84911.1 protein of unknown function [Taphrina deformans PYCC 5710]
MTPAFVTVLCLSKILLGVHAATLRGKAPSVELELGKEYSQADIERLSAARGPGNLDHGQTVTGDVSSTNLVTGTTSLEAELRSGPVAPVSETAKVVFYSTCPSIGGDFLQANVVASFDGYNIHWAGPLNVDRFGAGSSGGGHGQPITGDIQFYHSACRSFSSNTMCRYDYYAVVDATVRGSNPPGIDVGVRDAQFPVVWKRPYDVLSNTLEAAPFSRL